MARGGIGFRDEISISVSGHHRPWKLRTSRQPYFPYFGMMVRYYTPLLLHSRYSTYYLRGTPPLQGRIGHAPLAPATDALGSAILCSNGPQPTISPCSFPVGTAWQCKCIREKCASPSQLASARVGGTSQPSNHLLRTVAKSPIQALGAACFTHWRFDVRQESGAAIAGVCRVYSQSPAGYFSAF